MISPICRIIRKGTQYQQDKNHAQRIKGSTSLFRVPHHTSISVLFRETDFPNDRRLAEDIVDQGIFNRIRKPFSIPYSVRFMSCRSTHNHDGPFLVRSGQVRSAQAAAIFAPPLVVNAGYKCEETLETVRPLTC